MNQPHNVRSMADVSPPLRNADRPTVRISHPAARIVLGVVASAAMVAASALVFGPISDQRALAMAGTPSGAPFQYAGVVDKSGHADTTHHVAHAKVHEHTTDRLLVAAGIADDTN